MTLLLRSSWNISRRWIKENILNWQSAVVASPDEGGTRRAGWGLQSADSDDLILHYRILAEKLHLPMALIHKESFNEDHIISGNVQDKQVG